MDENRGIMTQTGAVENANPASLRLAAVAGVLGAAGQIWLGGLHAGTIDPNNSPAVFLQYAESPIWTLVHIGQYVGTFLIGVALLTLARSIRREPGLAGAFAGIGSIAMAIVLAVFAVQMAVDGVALRETIATWVTAADADKTSAFYVAESVRWIEKGLSAIFQLNNGLALLFLGAAVMTGRSFPRWLGIAGTAAGIGALYGAVVVARTGFSAEGAAILTPASLIGAVFLVGTCISMWRSAGRDPRPRQAAREAIAA